MKNENKNSVRHTSIKLNKIESTLSEATGLDF